MGSNMSLQSTKYIQPSAPGIITNCRFGQCLCQHDRYTDVFFFLPAAVSNLFIEGAMKHRFRRDPKLSTTTRTIDAEIFTLL